MKKSGVIIENGGERQGTGISTAQFTLQNHHKRPQVTFDWHADVESEDGF